MAKNSYPFKIGYFECLAISDGSFVIPHDEIFANVPVSHVKQLLCTFDIAHYTFQLERPDWYFFFDIMPERAVLSRRQVLPRASTDKILVWAYHFPFPGLGHIIKDGEAWTWQPIEPRS